MMMTSSRGQIARAHLKTNKGCDSSFQDFAELLLALLPV